MSDLLSYSVLEELSETARGFMRNSGNRTHVSSITTWEIAVKLRLGKLPQA